MSDHLDKIAFSFFKLFAQYEYSLKAMGYVRGEKETITPDWDRFSNEIGRSILEKPTPEVEKALTYLLNSPPKRQILVNGQIEWAEVGVDDKSAQALFSHIRRVRNNLYHGGKFNGRWFAPDRSEQLMIHAITVLTNLVEKDKLLKETLGANHA